MAVPFASSLRSIEQGRQRVGRWLALPALALIAGWGAWMGAADVPLHAASASARLVRERAVHPIHSAVDGRVVALHVALERAVEAGDLLVELDATAQQLALAEERAQLAGLESQLDSIRTVVETLESAASDAHAAAAAAAREAELELDARKISRGFADEEATRLSQLEGTGDVSKLGAARARADAEKARVAVQLQETAITGLELDARRDAGDRAAELAERRRALAEGEGQRAVHQATIARLEHEIEARSVRAPAAGSVAEFAPLAIGTFVRAGEPLGAVVAAGRLAVEAEFAPAEVLGKVRLGQPGELALAGFPRAEFGTLPVEVERIASEPRQGTIRVELVLAETKGARVPLEHGLPGTVQIEVERTSPAALLLRSVGATLGFTRARADG